jgi:hypothetical protein
MSAATKLRRLIFAIRKNDEGTHWAPYRDAMAWYLDAYIRDTLDEETAREHIETIRHRWNQEGIELPIKL